MPPIRTAKNNASDTSTNKMWLKPIPKGVKDAYFENSRLDWDGKFEKLLGMSTRSISFGGGFVFTDGHINEILTERKSVCKNITQFSIFFKDVSYDAHNNAEALTAGAVVRLAKACPKLKKIQLQGTSHVGDEGLIGLFENCPDITLLELTGGSRLAWDDLSGKALDELRENPAWAPKLKNLILGERERNKEFMKAMRALSKERTGLTVTLLERSEVKKWGDWELEVSTNNYKKGRKQSA